ncbi:MAG: amidohydrolase [Thermodesulfobacteriota bacterium]|nr:amidohydrolase [Thermodesulfobacteriota bacterium]
MVNGNIITLEPGLGRAELVAVSKRRILYVGGREDLDILKDRNTRIIDCHGKTVLPGFNDAHCHFFAFAESLIGCTFMPHEVHSISDIQKKIREFSKGLPAGTWIKARAYDGFYLREKRHPTRWDLDRATSAHPVKLTHRSGNAHVLNSLAMGIVGISNETPEPPGAIIERELSRGEPNGILYGMGQYLSKVVPSYNTLDCNIGVKEAGKRLLSFGVTSIQDASPQNDMNRWQLLQHWKKTGDLKCKVKMMLGYEAFESCRERDFFHKRKRDELDVFTVKIILNETTGRLYPAQSELNEMVLRIHKTGLQVSIHAIEEPAIKAACTAIAYALEGFPRTDHRHRIEHCSVCPPYLSKRLASLGIMVCTQPSFIYYSGDRYVCTVPDSQLRHIYPIASLMKNGIHVISGSDCPVVSPDPLLGIYAAISRMSKTKEEILPEEGIHPLDALRMYTENGAKANFEERIKGTIAPGKRADLVVLSADPTSIPVEEMKDVRVKMAMVDGEIVWEDFQ